MFPKRTNTVNVANTTRMDVLLGNKINTLLLQAQNETVSKLV